MRWGGGGGCDGGFREERGVCKGGGDIHIRRVGAPKGDSQGIYMTPQVCTYCNTMPSNITTCWCYRPRTRATILLLTKNNIGAFSQQRANGMCKRSTKLAWRYLRAQGQWREEKAHQHGSIRAKGQLCACNTNRERHVAELQCQN